MLDAKSMFDLTGKTALVTGAGGYLGRVMCQVLHDNGAYVIGVGRHADASTSIDYYCQVDLEEHDIPSYIADQYSIDVLVNNAHPMNTDSGFNVLKDHIAEYDLGNWVANIDGALDWPLRAISEFGMGMKERGHGSIINIATMYALVAPSPLLYADTPYMNPPAYGAAKAGMLALTRYVASFWGRYGVRCNALAFGPFPKSITAENASFIQRLNDRTALGRTGRAEEVAGPLLFLASDASSYVTGHTLVADGGWVIQ